MSSLEALLVNLLSVAIGAVVGYLLRRSREAWERKRRQKAVDAFFGPTSEKLCVVHSSAYNPKRDRFEYPSCDVRAANVLRRLLEAAGREDNIDFFIGGFGDFGVGGEHEGRLDESNVVVLGGPKRNEFHGSVEYPADLRYGLSLRDGENHLHDRERNQDLVSQVSGGGYDFGLVQSFPRPKRPDFGLTLVAGIHGTGTLGACLYLCKRSTLVELHASKEQRLVERVLKVEFRGRAENVTRYTVV